MVEPTQTIQELAGTSEFLQLSPDDQLRQLENFNPQIKQFDVIKQKELLKKLSPEGAQRQLLQDAKQTLSNVFNTATAPIRRVFNETLSTAQEGAQKFTTGITESSQELQQIEQQTMRASFPSGFNILVS